ncbi:MAG: hypothetical protein HMLKMBBP_00368 [Planctomycetes bacterium]|nr:hypothetical protein [Planctomycetota bacterium]
MQTVARLAAAAVFALIAAFACLGAPAAAQDGAAPKIDWRKDVAAAIASGKTSGKPVMVCINVSLVDGKKEEDSAVRALREVIYRDPRVVLESRGFECALIRKDEGAGDYDPLRALGIEGRLISPQHIFLSADGTRVVLRREYWPHGPGEKGVEAMLAMMAEAKTDPGKDAAAGAAADGPPEDAEGRAKWIAERIREVGGEQALRDKALARLVKHDKDGDCVTPLVALLPLHQANTSTLRAIVRALGKDGLAAAALPLAEQLKHKEVTIRANAAVSLEYVGSRDKKAVAAMLARAAAEKDEGVANHLWRALGRCGVEDPKVRGALVEHAGGAKSEFASFGPLIGLAYLEKDEKAMREVEKILGQLGMPGGGRRSGPSNTIKRGVASWTLASIGDAKSGKFVRAELLEPLDNMRAFWVDPLRVFWRTTAEVCEGAKEKLPEVEQGVRGIVAFSRNPQFGGGAEGDAPEPKKLMDEARAKRDRTAFTPRGDDLLGEGE